MNVKHKRSLRSRYNRDDDSSNLYRLILIIEKELSHHTSNFASSIVNASSTQDQIIATSSSSSSSLDHARPSRPSQLEPLITIRSAVLLAIGSVLAFLFAVFYLGFLRRRTNKGPSSAERTTDDDSKSTDNSRPARLGIVAPDYDQSVVDGDEENSSISTYSDFSFPCVGSKNKDFVKDDNGSDRFSDSSSDSSLVNSQTTVSDCTISLCSKSLSLNRLGSISEEEEEAEDYFKTSEDDIYIKFECRNSKDSRVRCSPNVEDVGQRKYNRHEGSFGERESTTQTKQVTPRAYSPKKTTLSSPTFLKGKDFYTRKLKKQSIFDFARASPI